jgi:hypothetical protein
MTVTVAFPPEIEKLLRQRAAQAGLPVDSFIREMVEQNLHAQVPSLANKGHKTRPTAEQWSAQWRAFASSHTPMPASLDGSRESIYAGRGE